jgi:hypothetical protein
VLWLSGKRRRAGQLLTAWGIYLAVYLTISTGTMLVKMVRARPLAIGEEVCADSGCFAVDILRLLTSPRPSSYGARQTKLAASSMLPVPLYLAA